MMNMLLLLLLNEVKVNAISVYECNKTNKLILGIFYRRIFTKKKFL